MFRKALSKIYNLQPCQWLGIKQKPTLSGVGAFDFDKVRHLENILKQRFDFYKTNNLKKITPYEFRSRLEARLGTINSATEGYADNEVERQRDLSVRFYWGHNHDFGSFYLPGKMGERHIQLLANFCALFPISLEDFHEKSVFDIGCWTGGTSLLLATLGSNVYAIEEVKKYSETVLFLAESFGIKGKIKAASLSVYSCNSEAFYDKFDIIYFPGVIYHLSDPLIALRILYNACKLGGVILVESAGIDREEPFCLFEGSRIYHGGEKENLSRSGWNWFIPSPSALYRMLQEAGFDEVHTIYHTGVKRVYGYAKKTGQVAICKAGISVADIR